jgi:Icc-related predicted phosphoesterase
MTSCLFVSDLHGRIDRYDKLLEAIRRERPAAVFVGGDLLPHWGLSGDHDDFIAEIVAPRLRKLKMDLAETYPHIFVILGNDDPKTEEARIQKLDEEGLLTYSQSVTHRVGRYAVSGYAYVPPTPFLNKDWEKYDVSRYVPPGGVSPEEGYRSVPVEPLEIRHSTIAKDLEELVPEDEIGMSVLLFHTPPFETALDRVGNDGRKVDYVPLDLHVGSIAVRRFIESRRPTLTLHGHIHESARITGSWRDRIGPTWMFSAAHDGPELALVRFDLDDLDSADRVLI